MATYPRLFTAEFRGILEQGGSIAVISAWELNDRGDRTGRLFRVAWETHDATNLAVKAKDNSPILVEFPEWAVLAEEVAFEAV